MTRPFDMHFISMCWKQADQSSEHLFLGHNFRTAQRRNWDKKYFLLPPQMNSRVSEFWFERSTRVTLRFYVCSSFKKFRPKFAISANHQSKVSLLEKGNSNSQKQLIRGSTEVKCKISLMYDFIHKSHTPFYLLQLELTLGRKKLVLLVIIVGRPDYKKGF